jgi:tetratricopeptide (TPR) repeat protein
MDDSEEANTPSLHPDSESVGRAASGLPDGAEGHGAADRDRSDPASEAAHWASVAAAASGSECATALCRQAEIVEKDLGRSEEASALRRRALIWDPHHTEALDLLLREAEDSRSGVRSALLLARRFASTSDPDVRAHSALALARLERDALFDGVSSLAWIERGVEACPDDAELRLTYADALRERGESDRLLEQLESLVRIRSDATSAAIRVEASSLRAARGDSDLALTHLRHAAVSDPDDATIVDALIEMFATLGRHADLADALERRVALSIDEPERSAKLLGRLGELYEAQLFDPEAALDAFERATALGSAPVVGSDALERLRAKCRTDDDAEDGPGDPEAQNALAAYELEARVTNDRDRLGVLTREIERLHTRLGSEELALPWVQRWVAAAPEEPEALRALARLHDRADSETQLAATLETLDRLLPPAEQLANRRRLAELYVTAERRDDAARAFAGILELEPGDLAALEGSAAALRSLGDSEGLVTVLEELATHQRSDERLATRLELAERYEAAGDLPRAISALERAESEDGAGREACERLDDLLARMLRHEDLAERLARRSTEHDLGTPEALALDLRRASILLEGLQRFDEAAEVYRAVLERAPESGEARAGLERALRSSADAAGLAEFLEDQEAHAEDPAERDRLALERAVLLEDVLERHDDALAILSRLSRESEVAGLQRDARARTEQLLEQLERWSWLRDHLEQQLGLGSDADDARLHERLALLCAKRLDDEAGELAHLERVVVLAPERADVWQALAARYEREGRVADWARALEAELATDPDHVRELSLRGRLAELYEEQLARPERARDHYERVFELSPLHNAAAHHLVDAYEREERFEDLVRLLEARLAAIDAGPSDDPHAPSRRTSLRLQIAHFRESRLDDPEGAISALEVALSEVGPDAVVAEPLAAAYQRGGYRSDLVELCELAASAGREADERANWLIRLGDTHLERDEPHDAADAYRRALTERPGDRAVEASLRELYRHLNRHELLGDLLTAELQHLAGTDEIPVRLELVELLRASRPADALLHARRVLELAPRHAGAFEAAMQLSESLELPGEALEFVEARLRSSPSALEAAALELRRARLLAGPLGRREEAIATYRAALETDPDGHHAREIRAELASLLEHEQRFDEWLACWERMLRDTPPDEREARIDRAAHVAWDRLSPASALPWLERLRAERPGDPGVLGRITLAYRELGEEEALLRALEAEAEASVDPSHRRRCHLERASLLRALGAAGRALAALTEAGPDIEVLRRCEEIQRELGLHARRATTLEALLAVAGPDLAIHRDLAELHRRELGSPAAAIQHWEAARRLVAPGSGADIEMLRAMAETERDAGRIEAWARYVETELAVLNPEPVFDDRRRELRSELAQVYDEQLARPGLALAHLRVLLDAGDEELLGSELRERLELACLRLLRAEGDVVELERRLAARLQRLGGDAASWLELAEIREEHLRHTSAAQDAYQKARASEPGNLTALRGLRRTAEQLGRWRDVADALEHELENLPDADATEHGALLRALGDIHWHRLSSTTRASRCYAAALEANSADFAALRALERLLEAMEDWRGALDLYESEVEVLGTANPRRRREIWLRVSVLAGEHARDSARACHALQRAAEIEPLETPKLFELASLHDELGNREAFVAAFASWCDAPDATASVDDHLRLALALEDLDRLDASVERVERALEIDASRVAAWDAAARLRAARGDLVGSTAALQRAAEHVGDVDAADRLYQAAEHVRENEPTSALALLRDAASRCPHDGRVQAARAELAAAQGEDAEAEEAAHAALGHHAGFLDVSERAQAARTGASAAKRRGRYEAAAGLYAEALRLDEDDVIALGAYGETLVALGDHAAARALLQRRLGAGDEYPERATHRALLGCCVERADEPEEALVHYEEALADDPREPIALEGSVRVLESLDRVEPGVRALERWARVTLDSAACAAKWYRAAKWELRHGGREDSAARHLREAIAADRELAPAWIALAQLELDAGRLDQVVEITDRAATHLRSDDDLAAAAYLQGRALEQQGARQEAADLYRIAAECDPRCAAAALVRARLLRGFGEWREAAAALATFAERHPGGDAPALAEVFEQLGRLRAGPLEDLDGAVLSYRRAIELAPERLEARAALAELLSHRPGDWDEALDHLRIVLSARPTHANCLRVALRVARGREDAVQVATGALIQRDLGVASSYETEEDVSDAAPFVTEEPRLEDARFELLRRIAVEASAEIATALGDGATVPESESSQDDVVAFRSRVLALQGELSAPSLLTRSGSDVGEVLALVVDLVLEPSQVNGDGALVNGLSAALGRRRRRKLRRVLGDDATPDDFAAIDWDAWQVEMRALAAAEALRRDDASLRTALIALTGETDENADLRGEAHLAPHVEADPIARAFLARIVGDWLGRL